MEIHLFLLETKTKMEILPQILTKHNFAEEYDELMIANYKYIGHIFSS